MVDFSLASSYLFGELFIITDVEQTYSSAAQPGTQGEVVEYMHPSEVCV